MQVKKTLLDKVEVSLNKSTQTCKACEILKGNGSKLCFENDTIAKEKSTLLGNFWELENKLIGLQNDKPF